jgi:hypothetical protein
MGEQFALPGKLHTHAAHPDQIGCWVQRQWLHVLIDDGHFPVRRAQRGQRGEPERGVERALAGHDLIHGEAEAPEAFGETRVDQQQAHAVVTR